MKGKISVQVRTDALLNTSIELNKVPYLDGRNVENKTELYNIYI